MEPYRSDLLGSSGWTSPVCEGWLTRDCDRLRQLTVEALDRLLA